MVAVVVWSSSLARGQVVSSGTPPSSNASVSSQKELLILIDAAHGGADPGALLTPTTPEKDITLAVARRLRQELNARGITCQLLRDGDVTLSADQRASIANTLRPALYLVLHASSQGNGLRVFTAMMPVEGDTTGPFQSWDTAQSSALERSKTLKAQLVAAVQKTRFPARALVAPLRPLNNVQVPAIAIEISPTTADSAQLASVGYQQMICAALANGIASMSELAERTRSNRP
jgi:N-acetylmuramoyl-L-alanine amidase